MSLCNDNYTAYKRQNQYETCENSGVTVSAQPKRVQRYRVIRFIEYVGTLEWVNDCIARRGIKGSRVLGSKCGVDNEIREGIIGDSALALDTRPLPDFNNLHQQVTNINSLRQVLEGSRRYGVSQAECAARLGKIAEDLSSALYAVENACR